MFKRIGKNPPKQLPEESKSHEPQTVSVKPSNPKDEGGKIKVARDPFNGRITVDGTPIDITDGDSKPSNPKDTIGSDKLPLHLWPTTATAMGCLGLLEGALKYGRNNFRESGVRTTIYIDACKRHLDAYLEGEDHAPDSGTPHLANALACLAIIVDAQAAGKLNDDRNYNGSGYRKLVDTLTPHVRRLKDLFADKNPKHYTIEDEIK
jgi:hypothetical protein